MVKLNSKPNEKKPYVNPVKCLNFEGGHNYEHQLRASISSTKVDPISGEMVGNVEKTYILELVCRDCMDRRLLHTKTVDVATTISLAQMLTEYREKLAEEYYAKQAEQTQTIGGR